MIDVGNLEDTLEGYGELSLIIEKMGNLDKNSGASLCFFLFKG
jgi:hypothetical protein